MSWVLSKVSKNNLELIPSIIFLFVSVGIIFGILDSLIRVTN